MREWLSGNLLIFLAFERLVLLSSQFCGTSVTVLGGYCFFLWPTFLFTHVTKRDSGHTNVSPSVQRNILPLTCQNNVTPRWGTEKLQIGFFFFSPTVPFTSSHSNHSHSPFCIYSYHGWSQAQMLTAEVIMSSLVQVTPNLRRVGKTVMKDHITPLTQGTDNSK